MKRLKDGKGVMKERQEEEREEEKTMRLESWKTVEEAQVSSVEEGREKY